MARRYKKVDVQVHSEGFGRMARPAVNVKIRNFPRASQVEERFKCSEEVAEKALGFAWESACEQFWENVQELADFHLGKGCKVYSEGRSGGWAVVEGLPSVQDWDAVQLGKWAGFEKAVEADVAYRTSWEAVEDNIEANRWAEERAEKYNFVDKGDGKTLCLADIPRCAHCSGRA